MFRENKTLSEVVVELDLDANAVLEYHGDYLRLVRMNSLLGIYKDLKDNWPVFIHFYRRIKKEGLNKQDITKLLDNQMFFYTLQRSLLQRLYSRRSLIRCYGQPTFRELSYRLLPVAFG